MTNLFYPALSIYLQKRSLHPNRGVSFDHPENSQSSRGRSWSTSPSHPSLIDSFFPHTSPTIPELPWRGWWDDTGQVGDSDWYLTPSRGIANEEEVQIVRIAWAEVQDIVQSDSPDTSHSWTAQDYQILDLVRRNAEDWEERYSGEGCVRTLKAEGADVKASGDCLIFSPDAVKGTISLAGLSHGRSNVSGEVYESPPDDVYHSIGLAFHVAGSQRESFEERWSDSMAQIAQELDAECLVETGPVDRWHLEVSYGLCGNHINAQYHSSTDPSEHGRPTTPRDVDAWPPKIVLFLYLLLFSVLGHQLSNATKVHSRFGLAFTGCVQVCCSAIMSLSVLALLGWNGWGWNTGVERSLPTYVLPFVIVVVGAENMSTLVSLFTSRSG